MNNIKALLFFSFLSITNIIYSATYYSKDGQDAYIHKKFFPNKTHGTYIEIGAHDGIKYSNTYFFERYLSWNGMCIEPIAEVFEQLRKNRNNNCICVQGCISDLEGEAQFLYVNGYCEMLSGLALKYDPRHIQRIKLEAAQWGDTFELRTVSCYKLNDLLHNHGLYHIDYLSIDIEGGELDVLKSIDFATFDIDVISVEDNYGYPEIRTFLEEQGFVLVATLQDLIFRNKKYLNS